MRDLVDRALALAGAPLFAALEADDLLPLAEVAAEVTLAAGETLFSAGDESDALYVVIDGRVDDRGAARGPGACVGELAPLDDEPRAATVTALEPATLLRIERDDLLDAL